MEFTRHKLISITLFSIMYLFYSSLFFSFSQFTILLNTVIFLIVIIPAIALKEKLSTIWLSTFLVFLSILFSVQSVYYRAFNQFGLISTLISMKNDIGFYSDSVIEFIQLKDILLLLLPLFFILITRYAKKKIKNIYYKNIVRKALIYLAGTTVVLTSLFFVLLNQSKNEYDIFSYFKTDHFIFLTIPNTNQFTNRFGLVGLFFRDVSNTYLESMNISNKKAANDINQILSTNSEITINSYSGLYEGKNLLLIEAESLNNFAIDPILTPTLYRLKTNGIDVDGYNSPLLFGSTSDSEFMANTSLYPSNNGYITYHRYASNLYPNTLAKQFQLSDYITTAFHNSAGDFYNRTNMLKQLGYEFMDSNILGLGAGELDSRTLNVAKWIFFEQERYLSFWITYSGHQPYTVESLDPTLVQYYNQVVSVYPNLPSAEQVYLAKIMDFDRSLEYLIYDFEHNNKLNDLVIIIYGDHHPKEIFSEKTDFYETCESKGYTTTNCFETPFIIWDNSNISQTIQKVSNPLDIAPTIYDLFNLDYDKSSIVGRSIFDQSYEGYYFDEFGTIKTDNFMYNSIDHSIISFNNTSDDSNLITAQALYQKMQILRKLVDINYFKELETEIE